METYRSLADLRVEAEAKPACVAELVGRYYFAVSTAPVR